MKARRPIVISGVVLAAAAAVAVFLGTGRFTSQAVQNPTMSLDMAPAGNTYDETTNSMTVGPTDYCLTSPTANPNTHAHQAHLVIHDVEDMIGWQVRLNYIGDKMRPNTVNFTPFTDTGNAQGVSFNNLPIDQTTSVHRDQVTASSIPAGAPGPQTASFGASYLGAQNFAISPDTPAKPVSDDSSYSAPSGGVLTSMVLQVLGNQQGQQLFMNLDDSSPNAPGSGVSYFTGTASQEIFLPSNALADGFHGEGVTCVPQDCTTQECPPVPTPTAVPTPTPSPTPTGIPLTLTVNSTGDEPDLSPGDDVCDSGGACTLRAAIQEANAKAAHDTINFSIGSGVQTIAPRTPTPEITNPVTIDGTTQPGFAGSPIVELSGTNVQVASSGLYVTAGESTVRDLVINGFTNGIVLATGDGNVVEGNFVGTDVTGSQSRRNYFYGIVAGYSSGRNTIGGTTPEARNVISGNQDGVVIETGPGEPGNLIQGNHIGTDPTGRIPVGNTRGIRIESSPGNVIGGAGKGMRNLVSANGGTGIEIRGFNSRGNVVEGNFVGTNVDGTGPLANGTGISMVGSPVGASDNTIGGVEPGEGNLISGNGSAGVEISGDAPSNRILGNLIGTDSSGVHPLGNFFGVWISAPSSLVGGLTSGEGNVIAFNRGAGVFVRAGNGNSIRGNSIYSNSGKGIENTAFQRPSPPIITAAGSASGTACANCTIDVYSDDEDEGRIYHGSTIADSPSGNWRFAGAVVGPNVTATVTDLNGSTSEFSAPFVLPQPTLTPTPTPTVTATATPTPTPTPIGVHDAAALKISVPNEGGATTPIEARVQNKGDHTETLGVYADAIPPGGPSNPYGCAPSGRIIETTMTLEPGKKTTVSSADFAFTCADAAGARGQRFTIVALVDAHADDLAACGPGQLQSMACFNALANDDSGPSNNRISRTCCRVGEN